MPIKNAAKKALRHSKRRHALNQTVIKKTREVLKAARKAISEKKIDDAKSAVVTAIKTLDRAYAKGVYEKNAVARTKSRLHAALKKISTK
jgi:small subunit ribosomal protein S20